MANPFTIHIFVADGDPEGVRIIDRMNWTGRGFVFRRSDWTDVKKRNEMTKAGIYILVGYGSDEDERPTLYIGQADGVKVRIDSHYKSKDFWDWAAVFVSTTSGGLNRAHVTWLEYALLKRANEIGQCVLDNGNLPQEPAMAEAEKADTQGFLNEILQILPLVGLRAFERPKAVPVGSSGQQANGESRDTIIVPAKADGFKKVFLGEDCWYAIRIAGGMLGKIKYIACYQSHPISAITHYAPVARIEPYGDRGKYKVVFSEPARRIGPIEYGDSLPGSMQSTRYASFSNLKRAKQLTDLLEKN